MKVGIDAKRAFHNSRGLGVYSRNLINSLADQKLFLFNPKPGKHYKTISNNHQEIQASGYWKFAPSLWRSFHIANLLKGMNLDLYHGLSHELPYGIEQLKIKKVLTVHDINYLVHPQHFNFIDRKIYHSKMKYALKNSDAVIAISQKVKEELLESFDLDSNCVHVIHQGISDHFFNHQVNTSESKMSNYIIYVGALDSHKNIKNLLLAHQKFYAQTKMKLVIVSRGGTEFKELESLLKNDRIKLKMDVDEVELKSLIQGAGFLVMPSFAEGFGLPIMEAYALKTPVVMSNISVFKDITGGIGSFFNPYDVEDMTKKMLEALSIDNEFKGQIYKQAQKYRLSSSSQKITQLYQALLTSD